MSSIQQPSEREQPKKYQKRLTSPEELHFPEGYTLTQSWERAVRERDRGSWINDAERMVRLDGSSSPKRVLFALESDKLHAECSCESWKYRNWCAHVASCWWQWVRGLLVIRHLDTGRDYQHPPAWLQFDHDRGRDLGGLSSGQLDAFLTCELGDTGVREYARHTDRSPGTIGNQLRTAREKIKNGGGRA